VALCRVCAAGLCLEHLLDTAARLATVEILEVCHHDTWAIPDSRGPQAEAAQAKGHAVRPNRPPLDRT